MRAGTLERYKQDDIVAALGSTRLLGALDPASLRAIAEDCREYRYRDGEAVFSVGEDGDALYAVVSGRIAVSDAEGRIVAELLSGDSFGEMELFATAKRNAAAAAVGPTELVRFPRRGLSLDSVLAKHPGTSALVLRAFLEVVAKRIRSANALVKENSPWVRELQRQAYDDKLTGLRNRAFLEESLPRRCSAGGERVALLMVKPDNFKEMNDRYGHEAGDATLKALAAELRRIFPGEDCCGRYMGNELSVVLPGADRSQAAAAAGRAMEVVSRMDLSALTGGEPFRLSASVGIALYPDHAADAQALIAAAHALPLVGRAQGGDRALFPEDA